jgi:sulfatase modifying factor 1
MKQAAEATWVLVPGGRCRHGDQGRLVVIGDLYWTTTPVTAGHLGEPGDPDLPVTGMDYEAAQEIAAEFGGRLPRSTEWEWMAAGAEQRQYPWGNRPWTPSLANLRGSGYSRLVPARAHPAGATPDGLLDVAGNVWEWTATPVMGGGFIIRGGSFAALPLYAQCTFLNAAPAELRSPGIGLRVVREP